LAPQGFLGLAAGHQENRGGDARQKDDRMIMNVDALLHGVEIFSKLIIPAGIAGPVF
jgi:hypothetical protein